MEIGLSTASFYPHSLTEDSLVHIGQLGVRISEVFLESMSEYQEEFGEELKKRIDRYGILVHSVHSLCSQFEPQLFSITDRQRQDALDILTRVFSVARMIGASVYVFHGPALLRKTAVQLDFKRLGRITGELADLAAQYGMKFSWENVHWCYYNYPGFGRKLMEHCPSDNLYFTLDIKQAMLSGQDPFAFLEEMGDRLVNVHVCDFDTQGKLLLPGRGSFDFPRLHRELSALAYKGPVMAEVYGDNYRHFDELMESYRYLKEIFQ